MKNLFLVIPLLLFLTACPSSPGPEVTLKTPIGLTATSGDGQVSLLWQASSEKEVAQYVIKLESSGDLPEEILVTAPATGTTVKQLSNNKSYGFRIAIETKAKKRSPFSEAITATPKTPPPPGGGGELKVATPTGLAVIAGDASVMVSWNPNPEADLKGYTLFWGTAPDALSESTRVDVGPITSTSVTGLINGTTYFFALEAENSKGEKSARSTIETATPAAILVQPVIDSVAIEGYGSSLQVRQGAFFILKVKGQRLSNLSAAMLGTLPANILPTSTESDVVLALTVPHGHAIGFLTLSLTTGNGTATKNNAAEVTEIWAAKSEKFKPSDSNPGTKERPFLTVTKALSVAATGDIVFLGAGTYEEGETWPSSAGTTPNVPYGVTVIGQARELVTLQGPGLESSSAALVFAGSNRVHNLTAKEFNRALVYVFNDPDTQLSGDNITLDKLELIANYEGLFVSRAFTVTIKNSTFLANGIPGSGSGAALFNFVDADIQNTMFTANTFGLYTSGARSVVLNNVTAQESELDGIFLNYIYSGYFKGVKALGNKRNGIYAVNTGEGSFQMEFSEVSSNEQNGMVIAGGAFATWDLGRYIVGGGNNTLASNAQWQLLDDRDASTGVTILAEGNLWGFNVTPGTYTATDNAGLEQQEFGVKLWRINRLGNSIAF